MAALELAPGDVLDGKYRVLRRLGEGAMGEVFLVEHLHLKREEALKVLHPFLARESQLVARFRREARAVNRLQHPNIVSVYDFGQLPDQRFYLAMEHADGPTVASLLAEEGRFSVARALRVLLQLAGAVAHAHERGVVHRDLKPENMVLLTRGTRRDVLKILDFGIAKILAVDYQESVAVTPVGEIFGTLAYMAPEILGGAPTTAAADLYAIGCIAYELLHGQPPFVGKRMELVQGHMSGRVTSLRLQRLDVPEALDALILRCLAKQPSARPSNAASIEAELARMVSTLPAQPAPVVDDEEENTLERRYAPPPEPRVDVGARTEPVGRQVSEAGWRTLLQELAERLIDAGRAPAELIVALARARELDDELRRNGAEVERIETWRDQGEQAARERVAHLRFVLGELEFEATRQHQLGTTPSPDLAQQMRSLEARIAEVDRDKTAESERLLERSIALVATQADLEERLTSTHRAIYARCQALVAGVPDTAQELFARVRELAQRLDRS